MTITQEDLEKLAKLSRFKIFSEKTDEYISDLNLFLKSAKALEKIEVGSTMESNTVTNVFRDDIPEKHEREKLMSLSKEIDGDYYTVPNLVD